MIFYFSGTGNSRHVAMELSSELSEEFMFIPDVDPESMVCQGCSIGFVFPVYSWGVPPLVLDFIKNLPAGFIKTVKDNNMPVWVVMTCGDEVAKSPEMITRALKSRGLSVESIWSVIMPNNYVLLPGFDVDPVDLMKKKISDAEDRIKEIATGIKGRKNIVDVTRGSVPWLRSMVYPLFRRWGISTGKWHPTDSCIGCGKCGSVCPLGNIEMKDGVPQWGRNCCSCLACYHICPCHAVAYGGATEKKGQYHYPGSN